MIILNSFIPKLLKVQAIVLYPFVLYASKNPSATLMNHERIHIDQIKKNGVIKFYAIYLHNYVIFRFQGLNHYSAYKNIPFEVEAYENQHDLDYKVV